MVKVIKLKERDKSQCFNHRNELDSIVQLSKFRSVWSCMAYFHGDIYHWYIGREHFMKKTFMEC